MLLFISTLSSICSIWGRTQKGIEFGRSGGSGVFIFNFNQI